MTRRARPSRAARWLLERALPAHMREDLLAELDAEYELLVEEQGTVRARGWYRSQVMRSLAPALACRLRELRAFRNIGAGDGHRLAGFIRELRISARALLRAPAFTGLSLLMLAIGIGASSAAFSVIDAVVLRPLPYPEPENIVYVNGSELDATNLASFRDSFASLSSLAVHGVSDVDVIEGSGARRATAMPVSEAFFAIIGIAPAVGRPLSPADFTPGAPPSVIISHRFAVRTFGDMAVALGRPLSIDGRGFTIIGIMPPDFEWRRHARTDLWFPAVFSGERSRSVIGRLREGATPEQVRAEAVRVGRLIDGDARTASQDAAVSVQRLHDSVLAFSRGRLQLMVAVVALMLLVACANVGNLFLARSAGRVRELSIRRALGAHRLQLARMILLEAGLLAIMAAAVGAVLAIWVTRALVAMQPAALPGAEIATLDARTFAFALAIAVITVIVSTVLPGMALPREEISVRARTIGDSPRTRRIRELLVIAQVVASTVLFIGTGLLVRSHELLSPADPGFETTDRLAFRVELPEGPYADAQSRGRFLDRLSEELAALPGVEGVSAASHVPLASSHVSVQLRDSILGGGPGERVLVRVALPGYLDLMGMRIVHGRGIGDLDREQTAPIAVVNESFAATLSPAGDPIGRRFVLPTPLRGSIEVEVVGIVADAWLSARRGGSRPEVFVPFAQEPVFGLTFVLLARNPRALIPSVTQVVHRLDPRLPVLGPGGEPEGPATIADLVADALAPWRYQAMLVSIFAAITMVLTAGGLYGALMFDVARRSHEMGVRLALGARPQRLVRQVLGKGVRLITAGLLLGVLAALAAHRALAAFLFGVSPIDPRSYGAATLGVLLLGSIACWLPAARASRCDPLSILRHE